MARPKRYNLDYFSHDVDMRNDPKIKALRTKFGLDGYATYVMILEILGDADNLIIPWDDISIELYSGDIGISASEITDIVSYCDRIGLFCVRNFQLFCKKLDERSQLVFDKRGHNITRSMVTGAETGVSASECGVSASENTHSKVKESKVKESKPHNSSGQLSDNCQTHDGQLHARMSETETETETYSEQHKNIYDKFKKAYPLNGSAVNPAVETWLMLHTDENGGIDKICTAASNYAEYCKEKHPDTYPHSNFIGQAINFLEKKQFEIDWEAKKKAIINDSLPPYKRGVL